MAAVPGLLQQQEEDRSKVRPSSPSCSRTGGPADLPEPHIPSPIPRGLILQPCFSVKDTPPTLRRAEAPAGPRAFCSLLFEGCGPWVRASVAEPVLAARARVSGTKGARRVWSSALETRESTLT